MPMEFCVSIQLVSPASGERGAAARGGRPGADHPPVSIQLVSPASGEGLCAREAEVRAGGFPFN